MSETEGIRVQLARIEGKQDVTNERLDTANRINDERHAAVKQQLLDHGERIGGLEHREAERGGERKGIALSAKALWAIAGAIPVGALWAAVRALT